MERMSLKDCTTLASLTDYAHLEYTPSELPGMLQHIIKRAAEIGGEKVKEAAAKRYAKPNMMVGEDLWEYDSRAENAIRSLDVKQIIEGE